MKDAPESDITEQHFENGMEMQQPKSAKDFMKKVMYEVPLNKLYEVVFSPSYQEARCLRKEM